MQVIREEDTKLRDKERELMAHRYLYYIECNPVISDWDYDAKDREFLKICNPDSPINYPGSSLPDSYSEDEVELAMQIS